MKQAQPQSIRDAQPRDAQLPRLENDDLRLTLNRTKRVTLRWPQVKRDDAHGIALRLFDGDFIVNPVIQRDDPRLVAGRLPLQFRYLR